MARAAARAALPATRLRRGALPREVVAAARGVRRGRAGGGEFGGRESDAAARLLDGRRGGDLGGGRAIGGAGARARSLDSRPALAGAAAREAARRPARLARPLAAGHPGRVTDLLAARVRARPRCRRGRSLRADPGRATRDRLARALAVGRCRFPAPRRGSGGSRLSSRSSEAGGARAGRRRAP